MPRHVPIGSVARLPQQARNAPGAALAAIV